MNIKILKAPESLIKRMKDTQYCFIGDSFIITDTHPEIESFLKNHSINFKILDNDIFINKKDFELISDLCK